MSRDIQSRDRNTEKYEKESCEKQGLDYNEAINKIGDCYNEYIKFRNVREHHITERRRIEKEERENIEKISAQRILMSENLSGQFEIRKMMLDEYFQRLDRAIEKGDDRGLSIALTGIEKIASTDPLSQSIKSLSDSRKFLEGNQVIEI